jgi:hypothetical protein
MRSSQNRSRDRWRLFVIMLLSMMLGSCNQTEHPAPGQRAASGPLLMHQGLSLVEPPDSARIVAGQKIYVPAYSSIYISDRAEPFDLAITLAVRNTDPSHPIIVTMVRYLGQSGEIVKDYLDKPIQIAPLASAGFFVAESDRKAGALASFVVDWIAQEPVSAPISESTMAGVGGTQGISFVCQGRVVADHCTVPPTLAAPPHTAR